MEFIERVCDDTMEPSADGSSPKPRAVKPGCGGFGIRNFLTLFLSIEVSKAMSMEESGRVGGWVGGWVVTLPWSAWRVVCAGSSIRAWLAIVVSSANTPGLRMLITVTHNTLHMRA